MRLTNFTEWLIVKSGAHVRCSAWLGVMLKMAHGLDFHTNAETQTNNAILPATLRPESAARPRCTGRNTDRRSRCGGTNLSLGRTCNHPGNGAGASARKADDEASEATKYQERVMKRFRLMTLTAIFLLPSLGLWLISKVLPQLPLLPLLLFQGWITMSATAVVFVAGTFWWGQAWCDGAMTPNDPSSATRPTRTLDCNSDAMAGFAAAHG